MPLIIRVKFASRERMYFLGKRYFIHICNFYLVHYYENVFHMMEKSRL